MILCLLVGFAAVSMAQVQNESARKEATPTVKSNNSKCGSQDCQTVMKLKKEYLEKNFALKDDQKKPFWEAFDAYAKAEYAAFQKSREIMREAGIDHHVTADSIQYLSDKQIVVLYTTRLETRRQLLEAETEFLNAISQCLSAQQLNEYYQLDRKFKRSAASHKQDASHKSMPVSKEKSPTKNTEAVPGVKKAQ